MTSLPDRHIRVYADGSADAAQPERVRRPYRRRRRDDPETLAAIAAVDALRAEYSAWLAQYLARTIDPTDTRAARKRTAALARYDIRLGLRWLGLAQDARVSREAKDVLRYLIHHADRHTWECWGTDRWIAWESDMSERTVQRGRKELLSLRIVEIVRPPAGRQGGSGTDYRLRLDLLAMLAIQTPRPPREEGE